MKASASPSKLRGFVDIQVNGYQGISFTDPSLTLDDCCNCCRSYLAASGCAAFCPTVVTASDATYRHCLPVVAAACMLPEFKGRLLGIHLEGPFIATGGGLGAHPVDCVRSPDPVYFDELQTFAKGRVVLLTLSAEADGASRLTRHVVARGVKVALGHHMATAESIAACTEAGATLLTHLGNGVQTSLDRHHNPIIAGLAQDGLSASLITDSFHLPPDLIKVALRAKGLDRCIVVSDIGAMAGCEPGDYTKHGELLRLEASGKMWMPDRGVLAGSASHMLQCCTHLHSLGLLSLEELWQLIFTNPLALLGIDAAVVDVDRGGKGMLRLEYTAAAGFVLL